MKRTLIYRISIIIFTILIALYFVLPNYRYFSSMPFFSLFGKKTIQLGLDLQGGVSIVLGVEVEKAIENSLTQQVQEVRSLLREQLYTLSRPKKENGVIVFTLFNGDKKGSFVSKVSQMFPDLVLEERIEQGGSVIYQVRYTKVKEEEISSFAVEQAIRTIRNRVDEFGVAEPDIRAQSGYRIQVQLPGLQDTKRAIALLGQTASLEFRFVHDAVTESSLSSANVDILPYIDATDKNLSLPVSKTVEITGDGIADARPSFNQNGEPEITLIFSQEGAQRFANITKDGVGKRLAIILDGVIYSAPVIREAIGGGRASISGNFTVQEAQDLAIILRAGSLPAPVEVIEERIVGPSLGAESIQQGILATGVALLLVAVFMTLYYRLSGLLASCMMLFTLLFLFMQLGLVGATLTLPGIAGIVLVLGMSVDANVLIYERIREEIVKGESIESAVSAGFDKAFSAIFDSNITTLLTSVILYQVGTGPVRGFAVTLGMGIIASMYTSLYISKTCFLIWLRKPRKSISI